MFSFGESEFSVVMMPAAILALPRQFRHTT